MKRILAAAAAAALVFTGCEKSSPSTDTVPSDTARSGSATPGSAGDTSAQEGSRLGGSERSMSGMAAEATGNAVVADGGTALEGATTAPLDAGMVTDGGTLR